MTDTPTQPEDLEPESEDTAAKSKYWNAELHAAMRAQKKWAERGEKVEKTYNDQRHLMSDRKAKFNILWSNVETLRPAVYLQTPKAQVGRRYRDRDPHARFASELLQRCIQTSCEQRGTRNFDKAMKQAVRDRLLPGRGQVWTFYEPEFGQDGTLTGERVHAGYVPWKDFCHSVARNWEETRWCGRRFYKSKRQLRAWLKDRGQDANLAEQITLDCGPDGERSSGGRLDEGLKDDRAKAQIWEVWDREGQEVCFIAPGSKDKSYLFSEPVPVDFDDFFPCPDPLLATTTSDSYIPTPDYCFYQDQANQLNDLVGRISVLQQALAVKGIYDASWEALRDFLKPNSNNDMVGVEEWAMLAEGGGAKGRIEWFPVEKVAETLRYLYEAFAQQIQNLFELSGLSDIQRGSTDPDETLGAQRIKAQWGTLRTRETQKDVQRFASDAMNLIGEVIAEVFRWDTILDMAGFDQDMLRKYMPPPQIPPEAQQDPQAVRALTMRAEQEFLEAAKAMLRSEKRSFRIAVETDSTIEPDESQERQARIEIVTALTGFFKEAGILVQQGPEGAKLAGELILFAMRGHRMSAEMEQIVENAVEAAARKAAQPQPNPEAEKLKLEQQKQAHTEKTDTAELALDGQRLRLDKAKAMADVAIDAGELEADLQGRESGDANAAADREAGERQAARKAEQR